MQTLTYFNLPLPWHHYGVWFPWKFPCFLVSLVFPCIFGFPGFSLVSLVFPWFSPSMFMIFLSLASLWFLFPWYLHPFLVSFVSVGFWFPCYLHGHTRVNLDTLESPWFLVYLVSPYFFWYLWYLHAFLVSLVSGFSGISTVLP